MPTTLLLPPEIFRPSYGLVAALIPPLFLWEKQLLISAIERYNSQGELDDKVSTKSNFLMFRRRVGKKYLCIVCFFSEI
jgi:hypothetical protein